MSQNNKQRQKKLQQKAAKKKKRELEKKNKEQLKKQEEELNHSVENVLELINNVQYPEAKVLLKQLKAKYPDNAYVYYASGLYYVGIQNINKGINELEISVQQDPKFAAAYFNLAVAYQKTFKLYKLFDVLNNMFAAATFDDVIFPAAKKALKTTEDIIRKSENCSLEEYCERQRAFDKAYTAMSSQSYEEAIILFSDLLSDDPEHVQSFGNRGLCFAKTGQIKLALKDLDRALILDPNYELAVVNRAIIAKQKEGVIMDNEMDSTEYYREYADKSYIEEKAEQWNHNKD